MIKQSNNQWFHISDDKTHGYPVKFSCSRNDTMVPYICFYIKDNTNVSNAPIESEFFTWFYKFFTDVEHAIYMALQFSTSVELQVKVVRGWLVG